MNKKDDTKPKETQEEKCRDGNKVPGFREPGRNQGSRLQPSVKGEMKNKRVKRNVKDKSVKKKDIYKLLRTMTTRS